MARKQARPRATQQQILEPLQLTCRACGKRMRMAFDSHRTVSTLHTRRVSSHPEGVPLQAYCLSALPAGGETGRSRGMGAAT